MSFGCGDVNLCLPNSIAMYDVQQVMNYDNFFMLQSYTAELAVCFKLAVHWYKGGEHVLCEGGRKRCWV